MRSAFAFRDALLQKTKFKGAEDLWLRVLVDIKERQLKNADRLVSAFVLAPSQAAACERSFAQAVKLQETLGQQTSPEVFHAYMLVSSYGPDPEAAQAILSDCTTEFLQKERRTSVAGHEVYRHGRMVIARKRKVRSDVGIKRAVYRPAARTSRLRTQQNARKLMRGEGAIELARPDDNAEPHPIFIQMSPKRGDKKAKESLAPP